MITQQLQHYRKLQIRWKRFSKLTAVIFLLSSGSGCFVGESICRGLGHARESFGCKESKESSDQEESETLQNISSTSGSSSPRPNTLKGQGFGLLRMAPEQISRSFQFSGQFEDHMIQNDYTADKLDLIQLIYGVPLGGIDFETSFRRDHTTKAQTVLVSRILSYQFALQMFFKDLNRPQGSRIIFNIADLNQDRPFGSKGTGAGGNGSIPADDLLPKAWQDAIKQNEARWLLQVEDIYWRFLSRPPTPDEIPLIKALFLDAYQENGWTGHGWAALLYAVIASQEFWHL